MSEQPFELGGKCAFGTALGGLDRAPVGNPRYTLDRNGRTYVFSGALPRFLFRTFNLEARARRKAGVA